MSAANWRIVGTDEKGTITRRMPLGLLVQPGVTSMLAKRDGEAVVAEWLVDAASGQAQPWDAKARERSS